MYLERFRTSSLHREKELRRLSNVRTLYGHVSTIPTESTNLII